MIRLITLACMLLCSLPVQAQEKILVLPFDYVEMAPSDSLELNLARALRQASLKVLDPKQVSEEQGLDLRVQRSRCGDDLLCLVQVGELLEASRLIVAKVKRGRGRTDVLSINVIDVTRASLVDSLRWDVASGEEHLQAAAIAGAKQLLIPPDTMALFEIEPPESSVFLYGRPMKEIRFGEVVPYWSGTYLLRVEHAGYESREVRITLEAGKTSRVSLDLELDPLYIQPRLPPSRGDLLRGEVKKTVHRKDALSNPWVWMSVGVGAIAMIGGGTYMYIQQEQYNELAAQSREFSSSSMITGAMDAAIQGRELEESYRVGELSFLSGAAFAGSALAWMLLDVAWGGSE